MLSKPSCCLIPLKMNDIELPESASFCLLGLVFTPKFDWKPTSISGVVLHNRVAFA